MTDSRIELEIRLDRGDAAGEPPRVELRFADPSNEAGMPPARGAMAFDPEALLPLLLEPLAYGRELGAQLFAAAEVKTFFVQAITVAAAQGTAVQVRLTLGRAAADLQDLRWELLCDPQSGQLLTTSERIVFSRFHEVDDWRQVRALPRSELKALIAIAAPANVAKYGLALIDRDAELERARRAFGSIPCEVLAAPTTLERLAEALRPGRDLLYFVGHGGLIGGQPRLYLENDAGETVVVPGQALADRLRELARPPRLVVFASCESAGQAEGLDAVGKSTAQASLALRLAEAGVQALVAMQGRISFATAEKFFPAFFHSLAKDGRIDQAMAVARGLVRDRPDSFMPVLYLRLKGGRLWNDAHFGSGKDQDRYWTQLCREVRRGRFIPILGSGVAPKICPSHSTTAAGLVARRCSRFPLGPQQRQDLPRVLQYLASTEKASAFDELAEEVGRQVREQHAGLLPPELATAELPRLLDEAGRRHRQDPDDPFRILAGLPAKVYLNAAYDNLLHRALKEQGREPQRLVCAWNAEPPAAPVAPYEPSREKPVIHHLFGFFGDPKSLVLTEDDYFDFLIATAANRLIPLPVASGLVDSSLIFLGLPLADWSFRVLFRLILSLEGRDRQVQLPHVGVQVDPSLGEFSDPEEARAYLQKYFGSAASLDISIYWGSAEDFLIQLRDQLTSLPAEPAGETFAAAEAGAWD